MHDQLKLEYRSAQLVGVSFPGRTIELIVMPYETEVPVVYQGRMITEVCSRGAYDGIESRNDKIRVNRDHDIKRTCGRAVRFQPSRREGLVAELKISKTEVGEETLVLADDGLLDASAGFALLCDKNSGQVVPGAETWETRSRRRLNKLFLGHIALVPDPAYETANVLAVRNADQAAAASTPNLDRLRIERLREQYAVIDARYASTQH